MIRKEAAKLTRYHVIIGFVNCRHVPPPPPPPSLRGPRMHAIDVTAVRGSTNLVAGWPELPVSLQEACSVAASVFGISCMWESLSTLNPHAQGMRASNPHRRGDARYPEARGARNAGPRQPLYPLAGPADLAHPPLVRLVVAHVERRPGLPELLVDGDSRLAPFLPVPSAPGVVAVVVAVLLQECLWHGSDLSLVPVGVQQAHQPPGVVPGLLVEVLHRV